MPETNRVAFLCAEWLEAKQRETMANKDRIVMEAELIKELHWSKPEGSETIHLEDFKLTLSQPVNRKLDTDAWAGIEAEFPRDLTPVEYVPKLSDAGVNYLRTNEPDLFLKLSTAITEKPGKIGVKVERKS